MNFYKITETAKSILLDQVNCKNIAVDFTLGRGNDTLFLSENFNYVYSFDIQEECIDEFREKNIHNVRLILDSHENVDKYLDRFDCGMYNLGYLPLSDKLITTKASSTIKSLKKAVDILDVNGFISIILYSGHYNGREECDAVLKFCSDLNNKKFNVAYLNLINKINPPSLILINKIR